MNALSYPEQNAGASDFPSARARKHNTRILHIVGMLYPKGFEHGTSNVQDVTLTRPCAYFLSTQQPLPVPTFVWPDCHAGMGAEIQIAVRAWVMHAMLRAGLLRPIVELDTLQAWASACWETMWADLAAAYDHDDAYNTMAYIERAINDDIILPFVGTWGE